MKLKQKTDHLRCAYCHGDLLLGEPRNGDGTRHLECAEVDERTYANQINEIIRLRSEVESRNRTISVLAANLSAERSRRRWVVVMLILTLFHKLLGAL